MAVLLSPVFMNVAENKYVVKKFSQTLTDFNTCRYVQSVTHSTILEAAMSAT